MLMLNLFSKLTCQNNSQINKCASRPFSEKNPYHAHTQAALFFLYLLNFYFSVSGSDAEGTMIPSLLSEPRPDHGRQKEATMSRNLSKYALIFLLLALSGLIFLLRNIHSVEVRTDVVHN